MKIVVLDGHAENPGDLSWQGLEALGDVTVYDRTDVHDEALIRARIGDAEAVYTNKTPLTGATIAAAPNLQFIGVLATGYNVVDLEAARQRGKADVVLTCKEGLIPFYSSLGFRLLGRSASRHGRACWYDMRCPLERP